MSSEHETEPSVVDTSTDPLRAFPWVRTVLLGGLSTVVGYVIVVGLLLLGPAAQQASVSLQTRLLAYGNVFFNAHFVDVVVRATIDGTTSTVQRSNLLLDAQGGTTVPVPVYLAVPVVVLVAAGAHVGYRWLDADDLTQAAFVGAGTALGYGALMVLGRFLDARTMSLGTGSATSAPDLLQAAAFGLAYPVVFATLGGLLGLLLRRELANR